MRKVVKDMLNITNILERVIRSQGGQVRYSYTQELPNNTIYIVKDKRGNRIVYDQSHDLYEVRLLNGTFNRTNSLRGFQLILESLYK
jgi:hypothetical protein